jgi:hypothetical protein
MEQEEIEQLIATCETLSLNIVTEDGLLNKVLLNISYVCKQLYVENQSLIQLLVDNKIIKVLTEPDNIIAFPTLNKQS